MKKLVLLFVLVVSGCVPAGPWLKTESSFTLPSKRFSCELPAGWMRRNIDTILLVTRDGTLLQSILIASGEAKEEKQFPNTKKRITSGMLPHEAAEVVADNFLSDPGGVNKQIVENVPAMVGGLPGSRLLTTYQTAEGLTYKKEVYVLLANDIFYTITYTAPARHYFDRDRETFRKVVGSFKAL